MISPARLLVMGSAALCEGFSLIGAEVFPDADAAQVEAVLSALDASGDTALVLLESSLAQAGELELTSSLSRLRAAGSRIVVTEVPPLHAPQTYAPAVDAVLYRMLGEAA